MNLVNTKTITQNMQIL